MITPLIIHERQARWARQIRPRVVGWPVSALETRTGAELASAAARSACPLVVVDPRARELAALEDLVLARRAAPGLLAMVFAPSPHAGDFASLAREMGATMILESSAPPPTVLKVLARWLRLARGRSSRTGWAEDCLPVAEPWELLLGLAPGGGIEATPA